MQEWVGSALGCVIIICHCHCSKTGDCKETLQPPLPQDADLPIRLPVQGIPRTQGHLVF